MQSSRLRAAGAPVSRSRAKDARDWRPDEFEDAWAAARKLGGWVRDRERSRGPGKRPEVIGHYVVTETYLTPPGGYHPPYRETFVRGLGGEPVLVPSEEESSGAVGDRLASKHTPMVQSCVVQVTKKLAGEYPVEQHHVSRAFAICLAGQGKAGQRVMHETEPGEPPRGTLKSTPKGAGKHRKYTPHEREVIAQKYERLLERVNDSSGLPRASGTARSGTVVLGEIEAIVRMAGAAQRALGVKERTLLSVAVGRWAMGLLYFTAPALEEDLFGALERWTQGSGAFPAKLVDRVGEEIRGCMNLETLQMDPNPQDCVPGGDAAGYMPAIAYAAARGSVVRTVELTVEALRMFVWQQDLPAPAEKRRLNAMDHRMARDLGSIFERFGA